MRILPFLSTTGLVVLLASGAAIADPLRLRAEATVDGDQVRLSHLIEGLEASADRPVFRAPAPGTRGTIRTDRVLAAASDMGVKGIETGALTAVTIHRPGRIIARSDLQAVIGKALAERGATGDLEVVLDDHVATRVVDASRKDDIKVTRIMRDRATGRFEARLSLAGDTTGDSWTLTGSVLETREVAVPAQDVERGDALDARKLVLVRRPVSQIASDIVVTEADLIGMVPRRSLRAGEPIRSSDLAKPILVEKNQLVTVIYSAGGLTLSMRGRAQGAGSMGEPVRIQNPQSKRIVDGIISGPAQVTITAPPAPQPNLAEAAPAARR